MSVRGPGNVFIVVSGAWPRRVSGTEDQVEPNQDDLHAYTGSIPRKESDFAQSGRVLMFSWQFRPTRYHDTSQRLDWGAILATSDHTPAFSNGKATIRATTGRFIAVILQLQLH
jgi:hypothetical protein